MGSSLPGRDRYSSILPGPAWNADRPRLYPLIRRLARRIPRPALSALCAVGAVAVSLAFVWPKRRPLG